MRWEEDQSPEKHVPATIAIFQLNSKKQCQSCRPLNKINNEFSCLSCRVMLVLVVAPETSRSQCHPKHQNNSTTQPKRDSELLTLMIASLIISILQESALIRDPKDTTIDLTRRGGGKGSGNI